MSPAISVRLDTEALQALAQLQSTGLSRSEAIRRAILDSAARLRRRAALAAEVAALEADEDDRREMVEVASFMESMRAEG
jgi:Arc/MetJ-type ribon-helix-helix transcriptional regulator